MPGKHASSDNSQFYRDLLTFGLRWLLGAIIVFGGAWFLTTQVFGADEQPSSDTVASAGATTSTNETGPTTTATPSSTSQISLMPEPTPETTPPTTTAPSTTLAATTTVAPTTTAAPLGPELEPSELTARVLNSTGRNGLAAEVTADLAALGYNMRLQDNYGTPLETTTVFYVAGLDREAATLASNLPGATATAPNPAPEPSAQLLVVLGSSYP